MVMHLKHTLRNVMMTDVIRKHLRRAVVFMLMLGGALLAYPHGALAGLSVVQGREGCAAKNAAQLPDLLLGGADSMGSHEFD